MHKQFCFLLSFFVVAAGVSTAQAVVIGNWESGENAWEIAPGAPDGTAMEIVSTGATLGDSALKVDVPTGGWQKAIRFNVIAGDVVDEFMANDTFSVDVTRLPEDWLGDPADGHSGLHFVVNAGGDGWPGGNVWHQSGYEGWWKYDQGAKTQTVEFNYAEGRDKVQPDALGWLELWLITNYDGGYSDGGVHYFDNVQLTPEPATIALLGLGGLALIRRRK